MDDASQNAENNADETSPLEANTSEARLRFARLEGRMQALEARFEDVMGAERGRRQRALYVRLLILALLLGGFFFLRLKGLG